MSVACSRKGALWDKMGLAMPPCDAEFSTFENHFVRKVRSGDADDRLVGLDPHQILPDIEFWQGDCITDLMGKLGAEVRSGRLIVTVPEQWQRIKGILGNRLLRFLSSKLMDRVEAEQRECRSAMSLFDDLAGSDSSKDRELAALLLDYIVIKKDYITNLRQIRRDIENIQKQSHKLLSLLMPFRQSSYILEEEE